MKTKNRNWISPFVIIVMGLLCLAGFCTKEEETGTPGSITDKDGNEYTSVTIGTQIWMVENLKTTKLTDGSTITNITDVGNEWEGLTTPGFGWWDNDKITFKDPYGAYYNWYAVKSGKLCPSGWHVPSDAEWATLISYLGGEEVAGGKLKETGTVHWQNPNTGATNETGFTSVGGGYLYYFGSYSNFGTNCIYWSATEYNADNAWACGWYSGSITAWREYFYKPFGYNVRCLKN